MAITYTNPLAVAVDSILGAYCTDGFVWVHHGTSEDCAEWIARYGLDAAKAAEYGSSTFWASTAISTATLYANLTGRESPPAVVSFRIARPVIEKCLARTAPALLLHPHDEEVKFEFAAAAFPLVNAAKTSSEVVDFSVSPVEI